MRHPIISSPEIGSTSGVVPLTVAETTVSETNSGVMAFDTPPRLIKRTLVGLESLSKNNTPPAARDHHIQGFKVAPLPVVPDHLLAMKQDLERLPYQQRQQFEVGFLSIRQVRLF